MSARVERIAMRDTYAAEATADEADSAAELAADETAELKEAAIPEAWLAALPVSALYCVLKPEVMTEPSDWVARMGTVVMAVLMALWTPEASEPVMEAAADAAEPVALAKADERMGRAAGMELVATPEDVRNRNLRRAAQTYRHTERRRMRRPLQPEWHRTPAGRSRGHRRPSCSYRRSKRCPRRRT